MVYSAHMQSAKVVAIAAIGRHRELGKGNELLWRIPDDLRRFKELSVGHPIILGRKTFESIVEYLGKPLPGRQNIVVTRDASWAYDGVLTASSVEEAIEKGKALDSEQISIGGGAQIYDAALPRIDILHLTIIDADPPAGGEIDAFFPPYEHEFTKVLSVENREFQGLRYRWVDLSR